jgi:hypothetical protein
MEWRAPSRNKKVQNKNSFSLFVSFCVSSARQGNNDASGRVRSQACLCELTRPRGWTNGSPNPQVRAALRCWPLTTLTIVCIAACEMTPGEEPLLCSCGKHSACLQPPGSATRKWQVFRVEKSGNKPRVVTSRARKEDAVVVVRDLCAGVYAKQNKPRAGVDAESRPVRKRQRQGQVDATTAPPVRATKPAGPGRGHKGPMWNDPVHEAERVLKKNRPSHDEMRYALERTTEECKRLRNLCEQVCRELPAHELSVSGLFVCVAIDCCLHFDR